MNLRQLLEQNPRMLRTKERTRALLCDVYLGDMGKVNLMMTAYSLDVVGLIRSGKKIDQFEKARLSKTLIQQHAIAEDKASWAIEEWLGCLSPYVVQKLDALVQEEVNAEQELLRREALEQAAALQAAEELAQKKKEAEENALLTRDDYVGFYTNPALKEEAGRIFVPCGVGNTDSGFFIHGIARELICKHPLASIYALVYNYLVRSSRIQENDIPKYIQNINAPFELDYRSIFRLAITLLMMIRHNVIRGNAAGLRFVEQEDRNNVKYAVGLINHYAELFSRLAKIPYTKLTIQNGTKSVSVVGKADIWTENNTELATNAREIWYGQKINYKLTRADLPDLETILMEISPFDSFKEGQFTALCNMLGAKKHAVCIMPTGSGKSLIYYFASILQPLPIFVVAPTEILIEDQIRNLKKFHRMDNVAHLMLTDDNSFRDYEIHNSINYVTPMTLQNRHLHVKFRYVNNGTSLIGMQEKRIAPGALISYLVLDEIHCLSNWGHDFRPEYLMLSKFLNKFLDRVSFWGFTATANYTVVEDVQRQLEIPQENFFSPISFEKFNASYDFRALHSTEEMYETVGEITQELIRSNQRTIVFTKNDEVSRKVADVVGYEADIFSADNPDAYHHFADGECKVLIASEELGVGINLPDVRCIIHFGLPLSKSEYVQEIGRAGRANEAITSYVLYLANEEQNVPKQLLKRDTKITAIPGMLRNLKNDYGDIYRKLTNNSPAMEDLIEKLKRFYQTLDTSVNALFVNSYSFGVIEDVKQMLFMLYTVGYVNNWYSYCWSKNGAGIDVMIDVCSSNYDLYRGHPENLIPRMKKRLTDYFTFLGNDREGIAKTAHAQTIDELIGVYVNWYYVKYLYHHNEQFLDLYDFIVGNAAGNSERITEAIKDFFVLPFMKLRSDEAYYGEMNIKELTAKAITGLTRSTMANIERINSNRYSYKLDYLLFCAYLRYDGTFEESRLERFISRAPTADRNEIPELLPRLYAVCSPSGKLAMLNYLDQKNNRLQTDRKTFMTNAYNGKPKDIIYYGFVAQQLNQYMTSRRASNV